MMIAGLQTQGGLPAAEELARARHLLIVAPAGTAAAAPFSPMAATSASAKRSASRP